MTRLPNKPSPAPGPKLPPDLPTASGSVPPASCRRLTLLATEDVADFVRPGLEEALAVEVRHVSVASIEGLYDVVSQVRMNFF